MPRPILLCTVGTSLFHPNLANLRRTLTDDAAKPDDRKTIRPDHRLAAEALAAAHEAGDWAAVAANLAAWPATDRLCGAEVNSVASLAANGFIAADAGVLLYHSDTADGRAIGAVLAALFRSRGHAPVEAVPVPDLQDADPRRFRTRGLRNLARLLAAAVRAYGPDACGVNATGGYKAQVAVAVLIGQAVGVPVYYMHERFSEIIAFPPLPVAFDFDVWMKASGLLAALRDGPVARPAVADDWDERFDSLVEATDVDGVEYLELSAAGQIFDDTFRERFRTTGGPLLPPAATAKKPPKLGDHGVVNRLKGELTRFLDRLTTEVPFVTRCLTTGCNPDLPGATRFRVRGGDIEGVYSDGSATVTLRVETTAMTPSQRAAATVRLNQWVHDE